jgi:hypothetical protein
MHRDVGTLEQRVSKKPIDERYLVRQVRLLFLMRSARVPATAPARPSKQQVVGMLGHQRLHEEGAFLGIQPGANPVGDILVGADVSWLVSAKSLVSACQSATK